MKTYTLQEMAQATELSISSIRTLSKKEYFPNLKIYKDEGNKRGYTRVFSENDLIKLKGDLDFIKESIGFQELQLENNLFRRTFSKLIEEYDIKDDEYMTFIGKKYIKETKVKAILKEIERTKINMDKYISLAEYKKTVSDELLKTKLEQWSSYKDQIDYVKDRKNHIYIEKNSFDQWMKLLLKQIELKANEDKVVEEMQADGYILLSEYRKSVSDEKLREKLKTWYHYKEQLDYKKDESNRVFLKQESIDRLVEKFAKMKKRNLEKFTPLDQIDMNEYISLTEYRKTVLGQKLNRTLKYWYHYKEWIDYKEDKNNQIYIRRSSLNELIEGDLERKRFGKIVYTQKEIASLAGISAGQISSLIKNDYFINLSRGKVAKSHEVFLFSEDDLNKLKRDLAFIEGSISLKELYENYSSFNTTFEKTKKRFSIKEDEYIKFLNKIYIKKQKATEIIKLLEESRIKDKEYISLNEYINTTEDSELKVYLRHWYHYKDEIKYKKDQSNQVYIHPHSVKHLIDKYNIRNLYYTIGDIAEIFKIKSLNNVQQARVKENVENKKINRKNFYSKESFNKLLEEHNGVNGLYEFLFIDIEETKAIHGLKIDVPEVLVIPKDYLSLIEMIRRFGYSEQVWINKVNTYILKDVVKYKGKLFFNLYEIQHIYEIRNSTLCMREVQELLKRRSKYNNFEAVTSKVVKKYLDNSIIDPFNNSGHNRFWKKDVDEFFKNKFQEIDLRIACEREADPYKILDMQLQIKTQNSSYRYTIDQYKKYIIHLISSTRQSVKLRRKGCYAMVNALVELLDVIPDEIDKLKDEDIEWIIKVLPTQQGKKFVPRFVNFYRKHNPNRCLYESTYGTYTNTKPKKSDEAIYTEEEWIEYLVCVTNVDKHIRNAFQQYKYATIWLCLLFHFISGWRKQDILAIPPLEHMDIDKYDINWFENNTFTMIEAQEIIEQVQLVLNNLKAHKNGMDNHIAIYQVMVIPVAIAIIAVEKNRRLCKRQYLCSTLNLESSDFTKVLGEDLPKFVSLKANRSLLTYCFNEAVARTGYAHIAYSLTGYLRSHKLDEYGIANVTSEYIYSTNKDGDCNEIALQVQNRGVFGWLYKSILAIAYSDIDFTEAEITVLINKMQEMYPVEIMEGMAQYILEEKNTIEKVIRELVEIDDGQDKSINKSKIKAKLKEKLHQILQGKLTSKIDGVYCWMADKCPYPIKEECRACSYNIPTVYTLKSISMKLNELMEKLSVVEEDNVIEKIFYTHQIVQLIRVVEIARMDFRHFDSESKSYVDAFLDIKSIKEKYEQLQSNDFLVSMG